MTEILTWWGALAAAGIVVVFAAAVWGWAAWAMTRCPEQDDDERF